MSALTVSACLIAKNERENVEPCLSSFADNVDEIVFVDTGSRDGTVAEVRRIAREHGWTDKLVLGRFKWCDHFAAARNYADSLASGDWLLSVDVDERLVNAGSLVRRLAGAPDSLDRVALPRVLRAQRDRTTWWQAIARASTAPEWRGRVHELRDRSMDGYELLTPGTARLVNHSVHPKERTGRNLRIATKWLADEPRNLDALGLVATGLSRAGRYQEMLPVARRYLRRCPSPDPRDTATIVQRQEVCVALARSLLELGDHDGMSRFVSSWCGSEPDNPTAFALRSTLEARRGRRDSAITAAARADVLLKDPKVDQAFKRLMNGAGLDRWFADLNDGTVGALSEAPAAVCSPRVSMCMIVKDGREHLRACLNSFWDHVDEVVVCDTGSRDGTVALAREFALQKGEPEKLIIGHFKWCDDFAAARNYAHSLATGDWHAWVDHDDRVAGAHLLRRLAASASPSTVAILAPYCYEEDRSFLWLPRLIRPESGRWRYRTYEVWKFNEPVKGRIRVAHDVRWEHRRRVWDSSLRRERRILKKWARDEPKHPMLLIARAMHAQRDGKPGAEALLRQVLRLKLDTADRGLYSHAAVILGEILAQRGARKESRKLALYARDTGLEFGSPEDVSRSRLLLAKLASCEEEFETVLRWTTEALERPMGCWMTLELCELHAGAACRLGHPEDAQDGVRRAMEASEDPRVRRLWGQLCVACGDQRGELLASLPSVPVLAA